MKDGRGRAIDYLRISLTDRCNMRCIYCMPEEGVALMGHNDILNIEEISHVVRVAAGLGIKKVRLTGGEPTVRLGIVDLVREIAAIPGIENISMTTNGLLLPEMAPDLKKAGLSRVNISLDTLDRDQFALITRRDRFDDAMAGIKAALDVGFDPVKINAVAVRSLNQDFFEFARMSVDRPLHVRFIEYMPVGESSGPNGGGWGPQDVVPTSEILDSINEGAAKAGLEPLVAVDRAHSPAGAGPARYYRFPGALGTVGFISPLSHQFCGDCNRLRLTADGKLRPCLFSDREYDIKEALRHGSDDDVRTVFEAALLGKPESHHDKVGTERRMSQIGG